MPSQYVIRIFADFSLRFFREVFLQKFPKNSCRNVSDNSRTDPIQEFSSDIAPDFPKRILNGFHQKLFMGLVQVFLK